MLFQNHIESQTRGRALVNISGEIAEVIYRAGGYGRNLPCIFTPHERFTHYHRKCGPRCAS